MPNIRPEVRNISFESYCMIARTHAHARTHTADRLEYMNDGPLNCMW